MELFIDFEGFYTENDDFIIKELAAISLTDGSDTAALKMFKPPAEYSNQVKISETTDFWQKTHGIRWEEGSTSYTTLKEVLMEIVKNKAYVYVLGEQEKQWLDKITGYQSTIINLMKMPCIERLHYFDPDELCLFKEKHSRTSGYACAFETVQRMKSWFVSCWGKKPSMDKSLQLFYQLQTLTKMHPQDIACLDETFILVLGKDDISRVWAMLPPHMQKDLRFRRFTRCTEHFITGGDAFDGPNPLKKDCTAIDVIVFPNL